MARPIIDEKKCTGCYACVDICPMAVFSKDEKVKKALVRKPEECINCRACEVQCPTQAIKVVEK